MSKSRELMGSLTATLEREVVEVEEGFAQVKRKREELEEEKRMMSSLPQGTNAAAEIVDINVGGEIFCAKRATLLAAEGSVLAAMFSGRWEESLDRDKDGRVFFDFDPAHFRILLNYLRLHRLTEPEKHPQPVKPPDHPDLFEATVEFLGMKDFLFGKSSCNAAALDCTQVGTHDASIVIDGHKVSGGSNRHCAVVGNALLLSTSQAASAAWKVSFTRLRPGGWVFAGVVGNPTPADQSCSDTTAYGWSSKPQTFTAGSVSAGGHLLQQGDNAVFQLDQAGKRLRMYVERTQQVHDISLQDGVAARARLHLNLHPPGTEVVVSAASPYEVRKAGLC